MRSNPKASNGLFRRCWGRDGKSKPARLAQSMHLGHRIEGVRFLLLFDESAAAVIPPASSKSYSPKQVFAKCLGSALIVLESDSYSVETNPPSLHQSAIFSSIVPLATSGLIQNTITSNGEGRSVRKTAAKISNASKRKQAVRLTNLRSKHHLQAKSAWIKGDPAIFCQIQFRIELLLLHVINKDQIDAVFKSLKCRATASSAFARLRSNFTSIEKDLPGDFSCLNLPFG
ncbi:MAG: hypothetical protein U0894_07745 [Pirellulales bacterium]